MTWVFRCLKRYASFSGRAGLLECFVSLGFVCACLLVAFGVDLAMGWSRENLVSWLRWYPAFETTRLLLMLPTFAVTSRRLHDCGRSAWWGVLWLLPVLGWVYLLHLLAQDGDQQANRYGPPDFPAQRPIN